MLVIDQPEEGQEENPQLPLEENDGPGTAGKVMPTSQAGVTNVSSKSMIMTL